VVEAAEIESASKEEKYAVSTLLVQAIQHLQNSMSLRTISCSMNESEI
jgi:cellobiose-specific phosphotransferase system component IIA